MSRPGAASVSRMRVLLWMIAPGSEIPGGHKVQLDQTRVALRDLGIHADAVCADEPDLEGYDVVHGFGLSPAQVRRARDRGCAVVLSTIYWSIYYRLGLYPTHGKAALWKSRLQLAASLVKSAITGRHVDKCRWLLRLVEETRVAYELADLLVPNSEAELASIREELRVLTPAHVVPNAVDPQFGRYDDTGLRSGILTVGRLEPHKNQMAVIEAARRLKVPATIVGPPHPHHPDYYERCRARAGGSIGLIGNVPHAELGAFYSRAAVHVLPSWFETTGLVSLEAALAGCKVVTTSRGFARDYFGDDAWYCDPEDPASIRAAIWEALSAPVPARLKERILSRFTWRHTALATQAAYERALRARGAFPFPDARLGLGAMTGVA